jgi:hypothetical protein
MSTETLFRSLYFRRHQRTPPDGFDMRQATNHPWCRVSGPASMPAVQRHSTCASPHVESMASHPSRFVLGGRWSTSVAPHPAGTPRRPITAAQGPQRPKKRAPGAQKAQQKHCHGNVASELARQMLRCRSVFVHCAGFPNDEAQLVAFNGGAGQPADFAPLTQGLSRLRTCSEDPQLLLTITPCPTPKVKH